MRTDSKYKSSVGMRSETFHFQVTEEHLKAFCDSVGAVYTGEAPPTYLTVFRDGEFRILANLGVPLSSLLHVDQEFRYAGPILSGDGLEYESTLTKALEKGGPGGATLFLVYETSVRARRGGAAPKTVGVSKTTVLSRHLG